MFSWEGVFIALPFLVFFLVFILRLDRSIDFHVEPLVQPIANLVIVQRFARRILEVLPFGRLWYGGLNVISHAILYAMH